MSFKVIGIGEVLWDLLPSGPQLGGAPGNFAFHARQLGVEVQVVTRIGNDAHGRQVLERFREMNIGTSTVQVDAQLPTGTASVALSNDGTPQFAIRENVAWDALTSNPAAQKAAQAANAVCFGTLAQRRPAAAAVIQELVAATPLAALRVFDLNLRQRFYNRDNVKKSLDLANVLKLNEQELSVLSPLFDLSGNTCQRIEQLASRFELQLVALTRAENGSALFQSGNWSELPGYKMEVVDTIGAGDAFTAAMVVGLLNQLRLEDVHRSAAEVANFVCSCPGATPLLPAPLQSLLAPKVTSVVKDAVASVLRK